MKIRTWSPDYPKYDDRLAAMASQARSWMSVYMNCGLSLVPKD